MKGRFFVAVIVAAAAAAACSAFGSDDPAPAVSEPTPDGGADATAGTDGAPMPTGDDGGGATDGAADLIPAGGKLVFVSAALVSPGAGLDSVGAGDRICTTEAAAAKRPGAYAAWMSTNSESALSHVAGTNPKTTSWYLRTGIEVVQRGDFSGAILHPIDELASGVKVTAGNTGVWTGTSLGGFNGTLNCVDWTMGDTVNTGMSGDLTQADYRWTAATVATRCNTLQHIYCFEK